MNRKGFTLLEVIAAVALFAISVLALTGSGTTSRRNTFNSEKITIAAQLLQMKMTEMEIEYQALIDRGGARSVVGERNGNFDKPFENFRWEVEVRENPFTLEKDNLVQVLTSLGVDEGLAEVQLEESALILNNLRNALDENLVELSVSVFWDEFGSERSMPVVTHLIPTKPNIQLSLRPDS